MNRRRTSEGRHPAPSVTMGRWNRIVVIVVGILLVTWGGPAASAFWSTVSTSNFAAAKADTVNQGAKPGAVVGLAGSVTVTWTASTTTAGRSATGYSIARYASATGGTRIPAAGTCTGTVVVLSCTDTAPSGTWYYAVTPMLSLWQGTESLRSTGSVVDATAPGAPVVTAPAYVTTGNVSNVPVSGTAEANSTVVLTVTDAGAAHTVTQTRTANGSGAWSATTLNLTTFNAGTITYSARATDAAGNTGIPGTATSVKDTTVPTVTNVQLSNGGSLIGRIERDDTVTLTFSEALDASKMCTAWTDDTTTQTLDGDNQVTVSVTSADVLSVTATGCSTLKLGTVDLGGNYTSQTLTYRGTSTNASVLEWNPTAKTITITLGALVSGNPISSMQSADNAAFTPASGLTDIAGNALSTAKFTSAATSRF
ncbi:hypothetical protein SAMN04487912_1195 [Arthrobacter sp. cf158]|uniref:hypothetical protein n=1 Tax=Arthrobacter sp. cf158 TaxID=1761744 RepID=UPI000898314A|nr:hypothetical protein [Arthrobacter sp. cf158]SDX58316.1 hypothetical protein SAMN04487912_1195 [Arthrobacter sp. cf158]